jgi:hypothetical protein
MSFQLERAPGAVRETGALQMSRVIDVAFVLVSVAIGIPAI